MVRGRQFLFVGWLVLVLLGWAAPVWAAPEGDKGGAGSPDLFKWALDLGLWTVMVFLILVTILRKYAWKPMLEGLTKREERIRSAIEEAKRAHEETERMRAEFQRELAKAHEQIPEIIAKARRDAERIGEELRTKAMADIQADRERLRREIEMAKDQALLEVMNQAAQLATLVSARAIRLELNPDDHRRLVDEALAELKTAGDSARRFVATGHA